MKRLARRSEQSVTRTHVFIAFKTKTGVVQISRLPFRHVGWVRVLNDFDLGAAR